MDLKSSSLESCKRYISVVPPIGSAFRFSSGRILSSSTALPGFFLRSILFAMIALLPAASFGQQSQKIATTVNLSASTIGGPTRTRATLTAQVAVNPTDAAKPTGSVSFMNGDQSIGAAFLDSDGRATYTPDALPTGMQKISAVYVGDDKFQASKSSPAAVNSTASGVPAFTLSSSATSLKVVAGGSATTTITATPENGFNQAITLSCSGAPYVSVTCVFSPAQVTPGAPTASAPNGTPALSTLNILTTAFGGGELREPALPKGGGEQTAYAIAVPGVLALVGLGLARKRSGLGKAAAATKRIALVLLLVAG